MEAKAKRKPISAKTRFDVFKRDGFLCAYCGAHPPEVLLHVDHIIPVFEGGGNDQDNLITSCERCNLGKGKESLEKVPMSLADKAKETAEAEQQIRGYQDVMEGRRVRLDDESWLIAMNFMDAYGDKSIDKAWFRSIKTFVEKIGYHATLDAMDMATAKPDWWARERTFRYFCGICWSKVKEAQNGAR